MILNFYYPIIIFINYKPQAMKTIPYSLFNLHERFLLLQMIEQMLESRKEELPELLPILQSIRNIRAEMEQALHHSRKSNFSELIQGADQKQDNGFLWFRIALESQQYNILEESIRDKAAIIIAIIRRHAWSMGRLGIQKQMAVSSSLITELSDSNNQQILSDLGVLTPYRAWKDAVDAVKGLYIEKAEAESTQKDITAATELGKQGIDLLEKVLPGWAYQAEFGNNEAYDALMKAIMESAEQLEIQARTRVSRRKASKEEEQN
jgi:hypothetical protein